MNTANPVTWGSAIIGLSTATIGLLIAFGVNITVDQSAAIMTFIGAVIVVAGFVLHNRVIPKSTAQDKIDTAFAAPPETPANLKPKA